ncbi:sugar phosphate isomerase/epimerase family protein [Natrarchaeobius chitinivorans]|uniref:Sugar phosphate isomerase/epimerase n=1 Tax=Natrarchaeobius chitinivorans TaxID=1679083 RepID=A0A3N6M397_NATCH|nr:sugar phosphate isomerase/epimerase [Natrarchaeobius chitinivorans]RQG89661.1 sugar phosphate isomerase/epimerase [Natrarchaeobius chitinivorans]
MKSGNSNLLASYWLHAGDADPLGRRTWSAWDFRTRVEALAEYGFTGIGMHYADISHMVDEENYTFAEIARILERNGMEFVELEFLQDWLLSADDYRRENEREVRRTLFRFSEEVGANHVKVGNPKGYPVSTEELSRRFLELCEEAESYDADIAFELFPYDPIIDTISELTDLVDGVDNGGVILDNWHVEKSNIDFRQLETVSANDIAGVEFADGYDHTSLEYRDEALNMRKLPGEGDFDIESFVESVKATGFRGPWGVEILSKEYRMLPREDAYSRAHETASRFI